MTSKIVVNNIEPDAGISSITVNGGLTVTGLLKYEDVKNVDSIGIITARSGIKIGATGANTLVQGTATGVGIGQASPEALLHIEASSSGASYTADAADTLILERNGGCVIDFRTPAANDGGLIFSDNSARAQGTLLYNHSDNSLRFGAAGSERLRITSTGQIRIDQATSANNGIRMRPSGWNYDFRMGAVSSSGGSIWLGQNYEPTGGTRDNASYGTNYLRFTTGGEIYFGTGATDTNPTARLRIASDGEATFSGIINQGTPGGDIKHVVKSFGPGFLGNGSYADLTLDAGQGGGTVTVHAFRTSDNNLSKTSIFGFQLRGTGTANVGSEIYGQAGSSGNASFSVTAIAQGIRFTNNAGATVKYSVTFDLTGDL